MSSRKDVLNLMAASISLIVRRRKWRKKLAAMIKQRQFHNKNNLKFLKSKVSDCLACDGSCINQINVNSTTFKYLCSLLPAGAKNRKVSNEDIVYLLLFYVCKGGRMNTMASIFGLSPNSISKHIFWAAKCLSESLDTVYLPTNETDWKNVMEEFHFKGMVPTLCCIDGKHIKIRKPANSGSIYFNYKKTFSIILFGACDSDRRFIFGSIGTPGSQSDSTVYNCSKLKESIEKCAPKSMILPGTTETITPFSIGDGAFALDKNLMKPFGLKKLTPREAIYNDRFCGTRVLIEQSFGILTSRFQILKTAIEFKVSKANIFVQFMLKLHNMLMKEDKKRCRLTFTNLPDSFATANDQRDFLMDCVVKGIL